MSAKAERCAKGKRLCKRDHAVRCCERSPDPVRWYCTRELGHGGNHIACRLGSRSGDDDNHNLATWPQEAKAVPTTVKPENGKERFIVCLMALTDLALGGETSPSDIARLLRAEAARVEGKQL